MRKRGGRAWLAVVLACVCWLTPGLLHADSWRSPTLEHWSSNRQYVLRVNPGNKTLTLLHVTPQGETRLWATSNAFDGSFDIPHVAYVHDDGRSVVLQDHYGQLGYGKVLVFLGEHGQPLHSYTLDDLFSTSEILDVQHSVSSIWWSSPGLFRFTTQGDRFGFLTHWGSVGLFDLTTGARLPQQGPETEAFRAEARNILRSDLHGGDVSRGVMLAGLLKDRESVPLLKQLLTDPSHCVMISGGHRDNYYSLQLAAGKALVGILGKEAAPLLEKRLSASNPSMMAAWIELIEQTGMAAQSEAVVRAAQNRDPDVRLYAVKAVVENQGITVVRRHPSWLQDSSENVRDYATRCLSEQGDNRDLSTLRRMLRDSSEGVRLWALRGLIRLKPADLRAILRRHREVSEARIALADSGETEELHWCIAQLRRVADPKEDSALGKGDIQDVVKVLVHRRPAGTEATLRLLAKTPGSPYTAATYYPAIGMGGLAALGDQDALAQERHLAATAEVFSATEAIEWLGIAQDRASVPLLRSLLENREVLIRDAARTALKAMGAPEKEPSPPHQVSTPAVHHRPGGGAPRLPLATLGAGAVCLMACLLYGMRRVQRGPLR